MLAGPYPNQATPGKARGSVRAGFKTELGLRTSWFTSRCTFGQRDFNVVRVPGQPLKHVVNCHSADKRHLEMHGFVLWQSSTRPASATCAQGKAVYPRTGEPMLWLSLGLSMACLFFREKETGCTRPSPSGEHPRA